MDTYFQFVLVVCVYGIIMYFCTRDNEVAWYIFNVFVFACWIWGYVLLFSSNHLEFTEWILLTASLIVMSFYNFYLFCKWMDKDQDDQEDQEPHDSQNS
jgi:hypothetical protein